MPKVSKFESLNLQRTPPRNRENVQSFIEGIDYLQILRSFPSGSGARSLSRATQQRLSIPVLQLSYARTFENAAEMAESHYRTRMFFRWLLRKPKGAPDSVMAEGLSMTKKVAAQAGRVGDLERVQGRARLVMEEELSKKRDFPDPISRPLAESAAFLAGLKILEDMDFPQKSLYLADAERRWAFIEQGFGIYLFDNSMPYLLCARENGNNGALGDSAGGRGTPSFGKA